MSKKDSTDNYGTVKLRPEDELLLCCARTNVNTEIKGKILSLIKNDLDWDYLLKLASRHRLMSLLHHNINSICPEMVPENILKELKANFNANVRKNLMLTGELIKVLNLLESEGITAIPYKGPVLASMAYGNIGLREFGDLDIYIPYNNVLKAREVLLDNGFMHNFEIKSSKIVKYMETQRDLNFHNEENIILEIHWSFSNLFFYLPKNEYLWKKDKSIYIDFYDFKMVYPSIEDIILILCLHNANHRWSSLSWICDITELIKSEETINWSRLINNAENLGIKRIVLINLYLANNLLGLNFPECLKNHLENDNLLIELVNFFKSQIFNHDSSVGLIKESLMTIKLRENILHGLNDFIKGLTTPTVYEWKTLHVPTFLWFIYYIYRPFNLLWRYKLISK